MVNDKSFISVDKSITGTLIWYYYICPREVWLMAHEICPEQDSDLLELGRIIHEESYPRDKKEFETAGLKIDIIRTGDKGLVVGEVKKSDRFLKSATMQLAFYLYKMRQKGVEATGELLIPKSKKKIPVVLSPAIEIELEKALEEISTLVKTVLPPKVQKIRFCGKCAYREFCFA